METKNLTKSFGIRVPLDMYLKMIEVGAENKISITDICLYSLANSGILKSNFSFKIGGEVNTDHINEIKRLSEALTKSEKNKNTFRVAMEESDEEVKRLKQEIQKLTDAKNTYHEAFSEGQEETKKLKETIEELKLRMKGMVRAPLSEVARQKEIQREIMEGYRKAEEEREKRENPRGR
jgi:DNA repair exonuclease SbcCD ATPase subunit